MVVPFQVVDGSWVNRTIALPRRSQRPLRAAMGPAPHSGQVPAWAGRAAAWPAAARLPLAAAAVRLAGTAAAARSVGTATAAGARPAGIVAAARLAAVAAHRWSAGASS